MMYLGKQIIADLYHCDEELLDDLEYVRKTVVEAAEKAETRIIDCRFHKFTPQGVSGVVVIAESHIAIHTWPEYGYAAIDIFTCGNRSMPRLALKHVSRALKAKRVMYKELRRGVLENVQVNENKILNIRPF
ncbi:MAG: adenosylmethionine decarboxylase [Candidatus Brockarchaeota archaeon]|nr:adenosylmethionine decarboxylase [Candidatus Brockarchaeota archaeon]MBO3808218.1 adenosylmethionine decarboxylase [Candidatus Brockarchaeota archaeon]MBO3832668.1 adenosylmethionine decarboxylase [Candidatus Brockarchaeota archaeon]